MRVLVTGTDGYIGVHMAQILMAQGHQVIGLDTGYYREGALYPLPEHLPETWNIDIRKVEERHLEGIEAVVHLAELSNDPLGQFNPGITFEINHQGSLRLAEAARKKGVKRFVYASSCSVYGQGVSETVDETSAVNPQTAYAECKVKVEADLSKMAGDSFTPTFMRNATAFGISPRQRFDIVLNNLCAWAATLGEIKMTSDGTPWRPLVHVGDICGAVACALEAPREVVHNQVFNVGDNKQNYRVREIAEIVAGVFPGCKLEFGKNDADTRSYKVNFDKIHRLLPAFRCKTNAEAGAREFKAIFDRIGFNKGHFENRAFTRLSQLKNLVAGGSIDDKFFWK